MRLPNKVTPYKKSVLARFPGVLDALIQKDMSPKELFELTAAGKKDMEDFLAALDCLHALGVIVLLEEGGVLHYVARDSV